MGFLLVVVVLVVGAIVAAAAFGALGQYRQEVKDPDTLREMGWDCLRREKVHAGLIYFQRAAEMGHAGAAYDMGLMRLTGRGGPKNFGEAFRWFQLGAERGYADAQCDLAGMYEHGVGRDVDVAAAYHYYRLAADQGHEPAVEPAEKFEAVAAHPQVAYEDGYNNEEINAIRLAVMLHYSNLGTMEGLKRSVEFGNREAALNVSLMYRKQADDRRAYEWMLKATEMGNKMAKLMLRMMRPEYNPSKEWFQETVILFEAAQAGDSGKQYEVGRRFHEGIDVDVDRTEAAFWFWISYKYPPSREALDSIPRDHWPEELRDLDLSEIA